MVCAPCSAAAFAQADRSVVRPTHQHSSKLPFYRPSGVVGGNLSASGDVTLPARSPFASSWGLLSAVVFLSTWFPYPPDNGSKIRALYLLRPPGRRDMRLPSLPFDRKGTRLENVRISRMADGCEFIRCRRIRSGM